MPHLEIWQWLVGALCAMCVGVAKTGLPGFGILVVPLIILTVGDARVSAAWLLPMLCTADLFAVIYWHRHAAAGRLFSLVPWVLIGMAGGALALNLKEGVLRPVVGGIVLVMLIAYLWRKYSKRATALAPHPVPERPPVLPRPWPMRPDR
ncbi:MAG: TSUP family transporter [Paludibaculum sp.]